LFQGLPLQRIAARKSVEPLHHHFQMFRRVWQVSIDPLRVCARAWGVVWRLTYVQGICRRRRPVFRTLDDYLLAADAAFDIFYFSAFAGVWFHSAMIFAATLQGALV
jgi:hypothetical protein